MVASDHDRDTPAYVEAVERDRTDKDTFFASSPMSPLPVSGRAAFKGLTYFPVDAAYRVSGLWLAPLRNGGPSSVEIPTSDGASRQARRIGSFTFGLGGGLRELTAYVLDTGPATSLFVPFLDATSGTETYGAGRYLDVEPEADGTYVLDFNLAYHPYCAYSSEYSCPLTPADNRLDVRVEAGERLSRERTGG